MFLPLDTVWTVSSAQLFDKKCIKGPRQVLSRQSRDSYKKKVKIHNILLFDSQKRIILDWNRFMNMLLTMLDSVWIPVFISLHCQRSFELGYWHYHIFNQTSTPVTLSIREREGATYEYMFGQKIKFRGHWHDLQANSG